MLYITWFGNLSISNRNRLDRITSQAQKIIGTKLETVGEVYQKALVGKTNAVLKDETHPLHENFVLMPSKRRYRAPLT